MYVAWFSGLSEASGDVRHVYKMFCDVWHGDGGGADVNDVNRVEIRFFKNGIELPCGDRWLAITRGRMCVMASC